MPIYQPPCKYETLFSEITEKELRQLQDELGMKLPEDLIDFLRQLNGVLCIDKDYLIPIVGIDEDDYPVFCRVYGMDAEDELDSEADLKLRDRIYDLRFAGEGYHFNSRVPSHFLAIGDGNSWDFLCMSLGDADFGSIYYWTPGEPWPEDEEVASTDYLLKVADSFYDFWQLLTIPVE